MDLRPKEKLIYSRGFTLAEVTIAVLVLSLAMVTMIGVQTASVERTLGDQERLRAMLAARAILASIETRDPADIEPLSITDSLPKVLAQLPPLDGLQDWEDMGLDKYDAELTIQDEEVPLEFFASADDKDPNIAHVFRVTLRIYWSDAPLDSLTVYYFVPQDKP